MPRNRALELHGGVLFDPQNVSETARYCRARNLYLQGCTTDADAAAEILVKRVLEHIRNPSQMSGEPFQVFDAWCVVDDPDQRVTTMIGNDQLPSAPQANFFVRLGRQPVLSDVNMSDGG